MLFTFEDMFPFLIISLFVVSIKTDDKVKSLCEDTIIHAADRLPNDTYRVYRDSHYWTLTGLPDREARVDGPFKIPFQYMAPIQDQGGSIMTIGSGALSGHTFKFFGQNYWHWYPNGTLWLGGKGGTPWKYMPQNGFSCAMSDGDLDKKGSTRMMGFWDFNVYYWKTDNTVFQPIGDTHKGYRNGQFGEKFPGDLTACMVFPSVGNKSIPYFVYLFNMRKYCFRPVKGVDGCPEWRQNSELFGCKGEDHKESKDGPEAPEPGVQSAANGSVPENPGQDEPNSVPKPTQSRGSIATKIENYLFSLLLFYYIL